jgi:hypothetical protein
MLNDPLVRKPCGERKRKRESKKMPCKNTISEIGDTG